MHLVLNLPLDGIVINHSILYLRNFFGIFSHFLKLILQAFQSLHLRHNSFSNPFPRFTYVTAHSPTLPLLHLRHSSFSNPSFASPTSQAELILQAFQSLYIRHNSFSKPSLALSTSQLILQPFFRFSYLTGFSSGEPPMVRSE